MLSSPGQVDRQKSTTTYRIEATTTLEAAQLFHLGNNLSGHKDDLDRRQRYAVLLFGRVRNSASFHTLIPCQYSRHPPP